MSNSQKISILKVQEFTGHRAAVYSLAWDENLGLLSGGGDGWLVNWPVRWPDKPTKLADRPTKLADRPTKLADRPTKLADRPTKSADRPAYRSGRPLDQKGEGKLFAKIEGRLFSIQTFEKGLLAGTMNGDLIYLKHKKENGTEFEITNWESPRLIKAHDKGIFSIAVLADYFLTGGGDGTICKWDFDGTQLLRKKITSNSIRSINLNAAQKVMALSTSAGHIYFINPENLEQVTPPYLQAHDPSVFSSIWNDSGSQLISGGRDALLKVWPYPDFEPQAKVIKAHLYTINSIAADPHENLLATASRDRTIKIWDKTTFALLKVIEVVKYAGHTASVNALLWNEAGLFSASDDKKIMQWEIKRSAANTAKTDS